MSLQQLGTVPRVLVHHHLDLTGVRDISDLLLDPAVHPRRHHPAGKATLAEINRDPALPGNHQQQIDCVDNPSRTD